MNCKLGIKFLELIILPPLVNSSIKNMIPKIIHQIWLGGKILPEEFQDYQMTWRFYHPTWEMKMWNESNIKTLKYVTWGDYAQLNDFAEKSDYLRIAILYEFGGLYVDTDMECRKPFDELIENTDLLIGKENFLSYNSAIIGSVAQNPILEKILQNLHNNVYKIYLPTIYKTGPHFIAHFIKGFTCKIVPGHYFYSNYWLHKKQGQDHPDEIFCYHYAQGSHQTKLQRRIASLKTKIGKFVIGRYMLFVLQIAVYCYYGLLDKYNLFTKSRHQFQK